MTIRTEKQDRILVVTLDNPEARNALNTKMREELIEVWTDFRDDTNLRVAILTGAGDKSFCAGADLKEIGDYYKSMTPVERRETGEREPGLGGLTRNFDPRKPVIAAINGHCLAGGSGNRAGLRHSHFCRACDVRPAGSQTRHPARSGRNTASSACSAFRCCSRNDFDRHRH